MCAILARRSTPQASADLPIEQVIERMRSGGVSNSGRYVSPDTAMRCSAVFACVNVIAQTVAQLPIYLYRRTPNGKELATDHPLYRLVGARPNGSHNSFTFREMMTAHTALRGNGIAWKNTLADGRVYELIPLHPDRYQISRDPVTWETIYTLQLRSGEMKAFPARSVLHIMGMTLNGYEGVSPITYARESIGLSLATEEHGGRFFSNGAQIAKVLKHPGKLGDEAYERMKSEIQEKFTGLENAHKTMILEEGMDIANLSMNAKDAQYLETRQYQIPEIARFWRMPLHKIQDLSRSTNNNIEHQSLEFLTDTMMPWLVRWEQSLNMQLLSEQEQGKLFFKFDIDDLMRADMKSRFEAYSSAITARIMNPNECREKEDMNPYPGGEKYENPAITPGGDNGKE